MVVGDKPLDCWIRERLVRLRLPTQYPVRIYRLVELVLGLFLAERHKKYIVWTVAESNNSTDTPGPPLGLELVFRCKRSSYIATVIEILAFERVFSSSHLICFQLA